MMRPTIFITALAFFCASAVHAQSSADFEEIKLQLLPAFLKLSQIAADKSVPVEAALAVRLPGAKDPTLTPPGSPYAYTDTGYVRLGKYYWDCELRSARRHKKVEELRALKSALYNELERLFPGRGGFSDAGTYWAAPNGRAAISPGADISQSTSMGRDKVWLTVVLLREVPGHARRSADSVTAAFYKAFAAAPKHTQRDVAREYKKALGRLYLSQESNAQACERAIKGRPHDSDMAVALCYELTEHLRESRIMSLYPPNIALAARDRIRRESGYKEPAPYVRPTYPVDMADGGGGKISVLGLKVGNTVVTGNDYYSILRGYDSKTDEFIIWIPKTAYGGAGGQKQKQLLRVSGATFRSEYGRSGRSFVKCSACGGTGRILHSYRHSDTKELPQGYFSGVEVKVTKSKTITENSNCTACNEDGVVLEAR